MKTKTSAVLTGGDHKKAPVSRNGIVPALVSAAARGPSELWKDVTPKDIGSGFAAVDDPWANERKPARPSIKKRKVLRAFASDFESEQIFKNKFVHVRGSGSKFIWFEVVQVKVKKPEPVKKKAPINWKNKLDGKTKSRFAKTLDAEIASTANFMVKELLPRTLSLHSAMQRVDELIQQLTDSKVSLPTSYLVGKQTMALHLRIIRFVSDQFDLTDEERKLMALEYTRPWIQS